MLSEEKRKLQLRKKYIDELLQSYKSDEISLKSMEEMLNEQAASIIDIDYEVINPDSKDSQTVNVN